MKNAVFYFTGTGNSLWISKLIASSLEESALIPITTAAFNRDEVEKPDTAGIVFPVYIWGVPAPVLKFLDLLAELKIQYIYAAAVNAGQPAGTLIQLGKEMQKKGLTLSMGYEIQMPSNYIPWGGAEPEEKQKKLFISAEEKVKDITDNIRIKAYLPVDKGLLWQRLILSGIFYRLSFPHVSIMDKKFFSNDKCTHCGICVKVCPVSNIELSDGRPVWKHKCEQCFSCLQWCPENAVQYGKKTEGMDRYHHPQIILSDIIKSRG